MNETALIIDNLEISWSAILIGLTIPAWFLFALAFCQKKHLAALFSFLPLGLLISFLLSRIIYWYSHQSRFENLWAAITSKELDTFAILGIIPGIVLACVIVRLLKINKDLPALFDLLSPATAFGIGFLYLTCRYHQSCLGRMVITNTDYINLPIFSKAINGQGTVEYRLAVYFIGFLCMMAIGIFTTVFYLLHQKKKGCTACVFVLLFSAAHLVLESARYDAGYFPFNGFVSIMQIAAAVSIVAVTVIFLVRAAKRKGFKIAYPILIAAELAALGVTGYLEYLVQRHGDKAVTIHFGMSLSCFLLAVFPIVLFFLGNKKKPYKITKKK